MATQPVDPTVNWRSTSVDRWFGGGSRWYATVDRCWPPLTVVDRWSGGGSSDGIGTAGRPRGTTQVVTRGVLIIMQVRYEVTGLDGSS
ncbi:hypothetical protein Tco_1528234, partial [Tanacetum coccineum]